MFLFTADWHIRNKPKNVIARKIIENDQVIAIDLFLQKLKELKPDSVFLLGDIFDTNRVSGHAIQLLTNVIELCKTLKIKLFFVEGQHDKNEVPILSAIDPYVKLLDKILIEFNSFKIYGLSILDSLPTEKIITNADFLVTHQVWQEILPFLPTLNLSLVDAKEVISGDYHKPISIKNLHFTGTLYPQSISEVEDKSVLFFDGKELTRISIPSRKLFRFEINKATDTFDLQKQIEEIINNCKDLPAEIKVPIIELRFTGMDKSEYPKELQLLIKELSDQVLFSQAFVQEETVKEEVVNKDKSILSLEENIRKCTDNEEAINLCLTCIDRGMPAIEEYFNADIRKSQNC